MEDKDKQNLDLKRDASYTSASRIQESNPYNTSSTVRMDQTYKVQRADFPAERCSRENAMICCLLSQRGRAERIP